MFSISMKGVPYYAKVFMYKGMNKLSTLPFPYTFLCSLGVFCSSTYKELYHLSIQTRNHLEAIFHQGHFQSTIDRIETIIRKLVKYLQYFGLFNGISWIFRSHFDRVLLPYVIKKIYRLLNRCFCVVLEDEGHWLFTESFYVDLQEWTSQKWSKCIQVMNV